MRVDPKDIEDILNVLYTSHSDGRLEFEEYRHFRILLDAMAAAVAQAEVSREVVARAVPVIDAAADALTIEGIGPDCDAVIAELCAAFSIDRRRP